MIEFVLRPLPDRGLPARATPSAGGVLTRALALAAAATVAPVAQGQVYVCTDATGRTTYQQEPCSGGQQRRVLPAPSESRPAPARSSIAQWDAAVAERRVVDGMPRQWVIQSLGNPGEKRAARTGERATEVWVYPGATEMLRIGFVGDAVAWTIRDEVKAPEAIRDPEARRKVAPGQNCDELRGDLGPPEREEALNGTDGQPPGVRVMRYVYAPGPGDGGIRLSFTCIDNKVIDIERTLSTR